MSQQQQQDEKPIDSVANEEKQETYTPKMKPGDVEIPNRVFVKGFPKETVADELFSRFEEYGKVIECRIVADRYGNSKGRYRIVFCISIFPFHCTVQFQNIHNKQI